MDMSVYANMFYITYKSIYAMLYYVASVVSKSNTGMGCHALL